VAASGLKSGKREGERLGNGRLYASVYFRRGGSLEREREMGAGGTNEIAAPEATLTRVSPNEVHAYSSRSDRILEKNSGTPKLTLILQILLDVYK